MQAYVNWSIIFQKIIRAYWRYIDEKYGKIQKIFRSMRMKVISNDHTRLIILIN